MTKQDCLDKLKKISEYKDNWNGYGAEPFDKDLIEECKTIIDNLFVYPMVFPTANNSIQLEYKNDNTYFEIEIFSDRYCLFCKINGKCADAELCSMSQAIDWWNVLTAIAENAT